jgi:hypothetical protein
MERMAYDPRKFERYKNKKNKTITFEDIKKLHSKELHIEIEKAKKLLNKIKLWHH